SLLRERRAPARRRQDLHDALLFHDRAARDPCHRRNGDLDLGARRRAARPLDPRAPHRPGARRHVLAPRRSHLDLPLAAPLSGGLMPARAHETSAMTYILTWAALVVLAFATFLLAKASLGAFQVPVALVIAVAKGLLVVLIFMHLLEQRSAN